MECFNFLQRTLHSSAGASNCKQNASTGTAIPDRQTCHARQGGLCCSYSRQPVISKLVKLLNRRLQEKQIPLGSLLLFTGDRDVALGILGVRMERPMTHVLILGQLIETSIEDDDRVGLTAGDGSRPELLTSQQLLQRVTLSKELVKVELLDSVLAWSGRGLSLQLTGSRLKEFSLDLNERVAPKKPRIKLLVARAKKTRTRKARKRKTVAPGQPKPAPPGSVDGDHAVASSRSSNDTGSDSQSDSDIEEGADAMLEESEVQEPISQKAAKEEKKAGRMMEDHEQLVLEITDGDRANATEPTASDAAASSSAPSNPKADTGPLAKATRAELSVRTSSFFSKTCGVADIDLAKSSRSLCYFCRGRIEHNAVRFIWFHSEKKPSAFVHQGCLQHLVSRDGFKAESIQRLTALKDSKAASGGNAALLMAVQNALALFSAE